VLSEICFGTEMLHDVAHILNIFGKKGVKWLFVSRTTYPAHITGTVIPPAHWSVGIYHMEPVLH